MNIVHFRIVVDFDLSGDDQSCLGMYDQIMTSSINQYGRVSLHAYVLRLNVCCDPTTAYSRIVFVFLLNDVYLRVVVDSDLSGVDLSCLEIRRVSRSTSQEEPTHQEDPNMLACSLVAW